MAGGPYDPLPIGNPSVLARRNWWQTKLVIFIGKHTPKCRDMVQILSQSMDQPLPWTMRIKKRLHYLICCWCQRYEEQLHYMRRTARKFAEHSDEASDVPVTDEMKERWKEVLRPSACVVKQWSEKKEDVANKVYPRPSWTRGVVLLAAFAVVMLGFLFVWRQSVMPRVSLADYRDEMISFAKVDPTLEMQSTRLSALMSWLETSSAMSGIAVPEKVAAMEPVGCRVLRYREHDVGLICFRRANGKLLHLFVTDRAMFPHLSGQDRAEFSAHDDWMTAAWVKGAHAYLMAVQGDQPMLENFLKL
jgi:hypothetical protein